MYNIINTVYVQLLVPSYGNISAYIFHFILNFLVEIIVFRVKYNNLLSNNELYVS